MIYIDQEKQWPTDWSDHQVSTSSHGDSAPSHQQCQSNGIWAMLDLQAIEASHVIRSTRESAEIP